MNILESIISSANLKVEKFARIRSSSNREYTVPFLIKNKERRLIIDFIHDDQCIKVDLADFVRSIYEDLNPRIRSFKVSESVNAVINRTADLADLEYFTILVVPRYVADRLHHVIKTEKIKVVGVTDPMADKNRIVDEILRHIS